jgi:hypothetical protein
VDRQRLAGQRGLLDPQVDRLEQAQVGRDVVAGLQEDDVARHQLGGRDGDAVAVAQGLGVRRGQLLQGSQGLLGPLLLDDAEHRVEHDDRHDRGRLDVIAEQGRDQRGRDQQDDDEVVELVPQQGPEAGPGRLAQLVGTVVRQPAGGLLAAQPVLVDLQVLQHLPGLQRVPGFFLHQVVAIIVGFQRQPHPSRF